MGKLKVGDKVRSLVTQIDVRAGALYEVKTVSDGDIWVIDDVGDTWLLLSEEFEILPVVAESAKDKPAFKVGDRVQIIVESLPWYRTGEIAEVIRADGGDNDCYVRFDTHRMADDCWYAKWDHLKLVSLKIEAGKFYRTRDGRKVGPIENRKREDAEHPFIWNWPDGRGNRIYKPDGTNYSDRNDDLIAEWVDEPVKAAAPVAVQQDVPELTVKLSFDAVDVTNAIKSTLLKTNQGYGFEIARHGDYVWVDTGKKAPIVLKATDVQVAA